MMNLSGTRTSDLDGPVGRSSLGKSSFLEGTFLQ